MLPAYGRPMKTAFDLPGEDLDQDDSNFLATIREHGWFRTEVLPDSRGPGFSYSTGFTFSADHPELIVFGAESEIARQMLWDSYRNAKEGRPLPVGTRTDQVFGSVPIYAFPVARRFYPEYLGWSSWFYQGDDFECLQLVWPDREGVFPWEPGFDATFKGHQPDLTESGWAAALQG